MAMAVPEDLHRTHVCVQALRHRWHKYLRYRVELQPSRTRAKVQGLGLAGIAALGLASALGVLRRLTVCHSFSSGAASSAAGLDAAAVGEGTSLGESPRRASSRSKEAILSSVGLIFYLLWPIVRPCRRNCVRGSRGWSETLCLVPSLESDSAEGTVMLA